MRTGPRAPQAPRGPFLCARAAYFSVSNSSLASRAAFVFG